uniref:Uncharacterized protein n=1 Tax=CrAss-like virus sp. ctt4r3 TaxID=2823619 RepID=A0A8S5L7H7_9CAUD|nr:MAG TPA: hypothetical protein [CrAss-like virus sp. ctt4r3]
MTSRVGVQPAPPPGVTILNLISPLLKALLNSLLFALPVFLSKELIFTSLVISLKSTIFGAIFEAEISLLFT